MGYDDATRPYEYIYEHGVEMAVTFWKSDKRLVPDHITSSKTAHSAYEAAMHVRGSLATSSVGYLGTLL